jgi:hypothetical protein
MTPAPLVRARHLISLLEHVDKLPETARRQVRTEVGPAVLAEIEASAGPDWIPFALDVAITHAIVRGLGPAGADRFFREQQLASFRSPLLRTLVDSATAIFGLDPSSWVRWIPRGWNAVFRECGRWEIDRSDRRGEVELALVAPPAGCLDDEVWLRSLASSFSSMLVKFVVDHVDRVRGAACYRLRWRVG